MTGAWHADDDLLARYVRGDAGALQGASVEAHLVRCAHCRARIATHVETPPLEMAWSRIREQAQAPAPSLVERLLVRLGVSESDARLVAVAPSLRTSWLLGLLVTLAFVGVAAAYAGSRGVAVFLLVAPLVPVAGVALAYGPDVDPAYEVGVAAPYSASRLMLLRTAAVLAACLPLLFGATLLVPSLSWTAVGWLVPSLALTVVLLAAATWVSPVRVGAGLGLVWTCSVGAATVQQDPSAVLAPTLLLLYAALGVGAALVLRHRLRTLRLTMIGSLS